MNKRLLILSLLFITMISFSQNQTKTNWRFSKSPSTISNTRVSDIDVKTQYDIYGMSLRFQKDFTGINYWADPSLPEMYIVTGVAAIDPVIYIPSTVLGPIRLKFDVKPPQVRLQRVQNGEVNPVWDWITGPVDTFGFSASSFQQWECHYDPQFGYINVMGSNPLRFYEKQVERLDTTFHSVGGNDAYDPHDLKYFMDGNDTLVFDTQHWNTEKILCKNMQGGWIGIYETDIADTNQSKINDLPCLQTRFLGTDFAEYYHPNSIDVMRWNGDTLLVGVSERHTSLIRFVWFIKRIDGKYATAPAFRLGSCADAFNEITTRNGCFNIEGGHDFRFIKTFGDSVVCSYYDNHACSGGAKSLLFTLYPRTKQLTLLDSVKPIDDQEIASQGLGSSRKILGNDKSYAAIKSAETIVNWAGNRTDSYDTLRLNFPPLGIDTLMYVPASGQLNEPGSINIFKGDQNHTQLFGMEFGFFPDNMFDRISGKIQVGVVYRSNAYLPGEIKFPKQPKIACRLVSADSVELSVAGIEVQMWSTGDTTSTIIVSRNYPDRKYLVRGKTDSTMRGWLYSEPFRLRNSSCFVTGISQVKSTSLFINIFPNPSNGMVYIDTREDIVTIRIQNMLGETVYGEPFSNSINMSLFAKGTYFITFTSKNGAEMTKKLLLQ